MKSGQRFMGTSSAPTSGVLGEDDIVAHNTKIFIFATMSKTSSIFHIVINTYGRKMTIPTDHEEDLYRYIWKILTDRSCRLIRIGGMPNHIHILIDLHPQVALADICGEIKRKSSLWMKKSGYFPYFEGWGKEYFGFSVSQRDIEPIINYIKGQKEHHSRLSFEDELKKIFADLRLQWDNRNLS